MNKYFIIIENFLINIFKLILSNNLLKCLSIILVIFFISSLSIAKTKVTLKKRNRIKRNLVNEKGSFLIEKSMLLKKNRDSLALSLGLISQKSNKSNQIYANRIIEFEMLSVICSMILSTLFFKFWIFKIATPLIIFALENIIISKIIRKRRAKSIKDFPEVVSLFTTIYAVKYNVLNCFIECMDNIPNSHKYEIYRLINAMQSGEDYIKALDEYSRRIDYIPCYMFVEILKTNYIRNENCLAALIEVENNITDSKHNENNKKNKLLEKVINIYFALICGVGAYLIDYMFLGKDITINYFTNTFGGEALILIYLAISAINILLINVIEKII